MANMANISITESRTERNPTSASSTEIPEIIGRIPFGTGDEISPGVTNLAMNVLPIVYITPCYPAFTNGMSLFNLDPTKGWAKYRENLKMLGYSLKSNQLAFVYSIDSLPSETFSNEYGATFLAKMADVVTESASDLAQISGGEKLTDIISKVGDSLKDSGKIGSAIGGVLQQVSEGINSTANLNTKSEFVNNMGALANKMLAGQRVDFPAVWKNSSFSPSYSINIRLYNPCPGNTKITEKCIVAPLAAILALVCPSVLPDDSAETYSFPLFCKVRSNGLFSLENAGITSVSITKGGAEGLIGFNNRVGLVDVRIDFQNLYNTMIIGSSSTDRPVVKEYLETLKASQAIKQFPSGSGMVGGQVANSYQYVPTQPVQTMGNMEKERSNPSQKKTETKLSGESKKNNQVVPKTPPAKSLTGFPERKTKPTPNIAPSSFFTWPERKAV